MEEKCFYFKRIEILEMVEIDKLIRKTKNEELKRQLILFLKETERLYQKCENDNKHIKFQLVEIENKTKDKININADNEKIVEDLHKLEEVERLLNNKEKELKEIAAEIHYLRTIIYNNDPNNIYF